MQRGTLCILPDRPVHVFVTVSRPPSQDCLGSRRIVLAFDPATDDAQLLRTVVQILRVAAVAASSRRDAEDIQTAEEKLAEALTMLAKLDVIRNAADSIRKGADKVDGQCTSIQSGLNRLLTQAQAALAGGAANVQDTADVALTYPAAVGGQRGHAAA